MIERRTEKIQLFYFVDSFFLFYYLVRTTSFISYIVLLSYYLVHTPFYFVDCVFFSIISCARLFLILYVVFFFPTTGISFKPLIDLFSGVRRVTRLLVCRIIEKKVVRAR